jgi:glucokinase
MKMPYTIGIDIGDTKTVFGVVNARGEIIAQSSIKTTGYESAEAYFAVLIPELNHMIEDSGGKNLFKGIGLGAPSGNYYKGCIEDVSNIEWTKKKIVPLSKIISEATGITSILSNDTNAKTIGEMIYGRAKGLKDFIMITLGTGVGSSIVANGQLIYGHDGFAGELGHIIVCSTNGRPCGCGRKGCLETYASTTGVALTAKEYLKEWEEDSLLRNMDSSGITFKSVNDAAVKGDKIALKVLETTGKMLGEVFSDFIAYSNPEAIILAGELTVSGDLLLKPIQEHMEANVLSIYKKKTLLLLSQLKESEAAILGASALAWEIKE